LEIQAAQEKSNTLKICLAWSKECANPVREPILVSLIFSKISCVRQRSDRMGSRQRRATYRDRAEIGLPRKPPKDNFMAFTPSKDHKRLAREQKKLEKRMAREDAKAEKYESQLAADEAAELQAIEDEKQAEEARIEAEFEAELKAEEDAKKSA
jgi:membrane protein involved in colicin uptake